jgi:hypothetical protein
VLQLKVGSIYSSQLAQMELSKNPEAIQGLQQMQQILNISPQDIQDATLSMTGITDTIQSVPNMEESAVEQAFLKGFMAGFKPMNADENYLKGSTEIRICLSLRTSKPFNKANVDQMAQKPLSEDPNGVFQSATHGGKQYYRISTAKRNHAFEPAFTAYMPDDKTVLVGPESMIMAYIDASGSFQPRQGMDFLDLRQQVTAAFVPKDTTLISSKIDEGLSQIPFDEVPPQLSAGAEAFKLMAGALKKVEAAALSGGITQASLQLVVSASFAAPDAAEGFSTNFNKLIAEARKIPDVAKALLAAQGIGVMVPTAQSSEKKAFLALTIPVNAVESLGGMLSGGGVHSQDNMTRWTRLTQTVSQNQWPHYTAVQKSLGQFNKQTQNVTLDTRAILRTGKVMQRNIPQVPGCTRWSYFDDPQGQSGLQLYFNPQNGQLIGFDWYNAGHDHESPDSPPDEGGGDAGGFGPKGSGPSGAPKGFPSGKTREGFGPKGPRPKSVQPRGAGIQRSSLPGIHVSRREHNLVLSARPLMGKENSRWKFM